MKHGGAPLQPLHDMSQPERWKPTRRAIKTRTKKIDERAEHGGVPLQSLQDKPLNEWWRATPGNNRLGELPSSRRQLVYVQGTTSSGHGHHENDDVPPVWWQTVPYDIMGECDTLTLNLNREALAEEVGLMAGKALRDAGSDSSNLQGVHVSRVGPAGIALWASVVVVGVQEPLKNVHL